MNPQGLYTLVSYGKSLHRQLETLSNNLANIRTSGYKEDQPSFQSIFAQTHGVPSQSNEEVFDHHEHLAPYTGVGTLYVSIADMGKNFAVGPMEQTGNPYDLALGGTKGFFSIATPQGERYTRAGSFKRNGEGLLVNAEGHPVQGQKGLIRLEGKAFEVGKDGGVRVDGQGVDRLKIVNFPFPARLQKLGNNFLAHVDPQNLPQIMEETEVLQGTLEQSNVDPFREMVRMIQANRAYAATRRALTSADGMNEQAISLAKV